MHIPSRYLQIFPVFLAFAFAACLILYADWQTNASALLLGVIAGGLVDMDHRAQGRLKNLIPILIAFSLCALSVQLLRAHPVPLTLLLTLLAFAATMLAAVDARYRTVGFCTLIVALYVLLSENPQASWYVAPLLMIGGTLIMQSAILLGHIIFPNRPVQDSLAASFAALADYMEGKARFFAPDEQAALLAAEYDLLRQTGAVAQAFNHTRDVLFKRLASQQAAPWRRRQLNEFFIAQDLHERVSAAHADYAALHQRFAHSDILFRIERLLILQARVCRQYSQALLRDQLPYALPDWLARADQGLADAWQYHIHHYGEDADSARLIANIRQSTRRLQTLGQNTALPQDSTLADSSVRKRDIPSRLRAHLTPDSAIFRHAVRMSAASFLCAGIASLFELHMGYWIMLTAVFVCQPNRAATKTKLIARIIGTILGVLVGSFLPLLAPSDVTLLAMITIANTLFFYFRLRNYSFSTFFITVQLFLSFALIGMDTTDAIWRRILDTLLGAAIAWGCVNLIFPDRRYQSARQRIRQALTHNASYLALIAAKSDTDLNYRATRRRVHESAADLAALAEESASPAITRLVQNNYRIVAQLSALASLRDTLPDNDEFRNEINKLIDRLQYVREPHFAGEAHNGEHVPPMDSAAGHAAPELSHHPATAIVQRIRQRIDDVEQDLAYV